MEKVSCMVNSQQMKISLEKLIKKLIQENQVHEVLLNNSKKLKKTLEKSHQPDGNFKKHFDELELDID